MRTECMVERWDKADLIVESSGNWLADVAPHHSLPQ